MRCGVLFLVMVFKAISLMTPGFAEATDCRRVADAPFIRIDPKALRPFQDVKLDRVYIFKLLRSVAQVETSGCWAGTSDNFDGQLISAGVLQWNYGQNSVQPLLTRFKIGRGNLFPSFIQENMPQFGDLVFSPRCLGNTPKSEKGEALPHPCQNDFLDPTDNDRKRLKPELKVEFTRLFESDGMIQVQMDFVMQQMSKTLNFAERMFGKDAVSPKNFHWMFDIIVQQGGFPSLEAFKENFARAWAYARTQDSAHQKMTAKGILLWYAGLAASPDQGGLDCDWRYNLEKWGQLVNASAWDEEKFRLFLMSWLRARTASGQDGRWQALSFQRRAKLSLDVGSVAKSSVHRDNNYPCRTPRPDDIKIMFDAIGPGR